MTTKNFEHTHADQAIFIASNSTDSSALAVAHEITSRGHEALLYEADKVAKQEVRLDVVLNDAGCSICYDGVQIDPDRIGSAWLRRPNDFGPYGGEDRNKRLSIDRQRRAAQQLIWQNIPETKWLNPPSAAVRAQEKLSQLMVARAIGLPVLDTTITNNWETITANIPPGQDVAFKMFSAPYYEGNTTKAAYTKRLDRDALPTHTNPFPGIAQPFASKAREWRLIQVGSERFDVSIYAHSEDAKIDWRPYQLKSDVEFRSETFPDEPTAQKCRDMLDHYDLGFGVFDLAEDDDGKITFFELNVNGQYGWLEYILGLPISQAIASELIRMALRS